MTRTVACLAMTVVTACAIQAQPANIDLPMFGPDTTMLSNAEALDLILEAEIPYVVALPLLHRVARSGDTTLGQALKDIAAMYSLDLGTISYNALYALEALGEPDAYFLANAQNHNANVDLASYSISVLAQDPDSTTWALIEPLWAASGDGWVQSAVNRYESMLSLVDSDNRIVDVDSLIDEHLLGISSVIPFESERWAYELGLNALSEYDERVGLSPSDVYSRRQLARLAAQYPTLVHEAMARIPSWEFFQRDIFTNHPPDLLAEQIALLGVYADSIVFEVDVPTLPPVDNGADVTPIVECIVEEGSGSLIAYFGYDNRHGEPVTIPYGATSVITPSAYDQQQPEVYYMPQLVDGQPGRTPLYCEEDFNDWAFAVRFDSTETVSWTLGDRTVTASSSWQRCADYVPGWQDVTVVPAAATLASPSVEASFSGNSFAVSGLDHDLSGNATGSGEDRHGIAVADETARQSILDELSSNQEGNVTGQDPAPDVAIAAPGLDVEGLVDLLLARADLITLDADPGNQTVGSPSQPAVAYAPDGLDVQGNFEGYGILVVEGTFEEATEFRGNASWTGLVIVRGEDGAQAAFDMSGSVEVIGAVVLSSDTGAVLDVGGSSSIRYSSEALQLAQSLLNAP